MAAMTRGCGARRTLCAVGPAALALLAGCAGGPREAQPRLDPPGAATVEEAFGAGSGILAGFELPSAAEVREGKAAWRFGDRVLLGLRIERDGRETVRYLEIELLPKLYEQGYVTFTLTHQDGSEREFGSMVFATRIALHDEAGLRLAEVEGAFPMLLLNVGIYDAVRVDVEARAAGEDLKTKKLTEEEFRDAGLGWLGLIAFSGSMGENRIFADLVADIVRRPPWWRLLLKPSFSLDYTEPFASVAPDWSPASGISRPAYSVPLEMTIAGERAVAGEVRVVPPEGPLGLCGGLVHAAVHRAGDPGTRAEIRLLGCRRGPSTAARQRGADPR